MSEPEGGRIFFARSRRAPDRDSEIRLVSVGVDIGSSTSHMAFSRIVLQRRGRRAQVIRRELLHESDILLTPYAEGETIDTEALGRFVGREYQRADIDPDMIDTGALILTGTAARTRNARAIGELFAHETGRFVSVAAGDGLETTLSAHGSGAVAASRGGLRVMNVDIGGGTSKIAVCVDGEIVDLTAIDIGARLIRLDEGGSVIRIEPAGSRIAADAGAAIALGEIPSAGALERIADLMADRLFEGCGGADLTSATRGLLRLPALSAAEIPAQISFSGGVAEYIHGREGRRFGDLGPLLADAVMARMRHWGPAIRFADQGIRATVIGASQYSVQLSGNTIFIDPSTVLPLASVAVIAPAIDFDAGSDEIAQQVKLALLRADLAAGDAPVAVSYRWYGDATHARIDTFCRGVAEALRSRLAGGAPIVLVGDGDVGGLIGLHLRGLQGVGAVVSIDGVSVGTFDHIDIGEILQVSGGVPVVVKSLVFPPQAVFIDR